MRRGIVRFAICLVVAGCGRPDSVAPRGAEAFEERLSEAEAAFARGDYPLAVEAYSDVRDSLERIAPKVAMRWTGVQGAEALRAYRASIHDNLGVSLLRLRRYQEAQKAIETALRLAPERALFHANLGTCWLRMQELEAAIRSFDRALELEPGEPSWAIQRAKAELGSGALDAAIAQLEQVLGALPEPDLEGLGVDGWLALGSAYAERGEMDQAVDAYARVLRMAPGSVEAWYQLSRALYRRGDAEEAAAAAARLVQVQETEQVLKQYRSRPALDPAQTREYAALLYSAGLPHEALAQVRKLARATPGDPCVVLALARVQHYLQAKRDAARSYRRLLALRPNCIEAVEGLEALGAGSANAAGNGGPCCSESDLAGQPPDQEQEQER